ncbi:MAG: tRNA (adenosine(37)-N6)-threonylcarbamoyltransferase complex ATPase subunit type 1 TsaE [Nocardioides sp.]|uniref:tRNA (adenosine(37)-N6)-threonylcarbamoyltransferase complex ATPase subunit type 1 TsaE n=1 Tax=Nocardioides sp. TaxID=35761 RepID=UPI0039E61F7A
MGEPSIERVGVEATADLLGIVRAAFAARPPLDPPADALAETEQSLAALLAYGGLVARIDGRPVGGVVLDPIEDTLWLRRFAVLPEAQNHGIAHRLVAAAVELAEAEGLTDLAVIAREELPRTVRFWRRQGFWEIDHRPPVVRLHRPLRTIVVNVAEAGAMRELGRRLATQLRAGDVVVLTGELGAGKTTFAQGLGEGLGVRGPVTSPTFVIARVHPSLASAGPALVHVDAYRLGGVAELDDLDLDTDIDRAVTVIEWGEGLAEGLAESRLEVRIVRAEGAEPALHGEAEAAVGAQVVEDRADPRLVEITPVGPRWLPLVPDLEEA